MRETLAAWRPVIDAEMETVLPREIDEDYLASFYGPASHRYDVESVQHALSEPVWDLLDRGGKRWRAVVFLVLVDALGEDPEDYLRYALVPEILHNGTIIVDDIEDDASMRRGEPALHLRYGRDVALNAGNALYFLPLKILSRNPAGLDAETKLAAYEMLTHELNRTHLGQGMDIWWHNELDTPVAEDHYLEMCACKTGCLGRIVARLAAIVTGRPAAVERAVARYAEQLSIAFQIGDDILDVEHSLDQAGDFGKAFGNDIREGKKTLMVIHALETADPDRAETLQSILAAEENSDEEILTAIDVLQETDAIEYARERALEVAASARSHLDGLDLDPEPKAELQEFTRFVIERDV